MARQIQIRRGTATEHEQFTGAMGEITMDTTNNTLRVHDGQTTGGTILAKQSAVPNLDGLDYVVEWQMPSAENNHTWYRKYKSGWIEQGGADVFVAYSGTVITFPVPMRDTNYMIFACGSAETYGNSINTSIKHHKSNNTPTSFTIGSSYSGGVNANWYACGRYM